jgi:hypothetical protein
VFPEKVINPHPVPASRKKPRLQSRAQIHFIEKIRVPKSLTDAHGKKVKLKEGAYVEVKIEADPVVTKTAVQREQSSRSSA